MVAIANGSEEMETVIIVDLLRRSKNTDVILAKVDESNFDNEPKLSLMSRQMKIEADYIFSEKLLNNYNFDCIVLPGGLEGAKAFRDCPLLIKTLKSFLNDKNKLVGAICASPALVLMHHNLLEKYKALTFYPALNEKY